MDCSSAALGRYGRKKARTDTAGQWHGTFQNLDLDEFEISALFTSLILLRVLMVTSLCLPDFLGACCSFMFVYSSVSVCFLRWNASLPALGKATKQRRCPERSYQCLCQMLEVATCIVDPQADGGSRMSWFVLIVRTACTMAGVVISFCPCCKGP